MYKHAWMLKAERLQKGLGVASESGAVFFLAIMFESALTPRSHDAVGEVLEAVVQLGGDGAHGAVHHLLHQNLQLFLSQAHVKSLLQVADGAGAMEAGQLGTWRATTNSNHEEKIVTTGELYCHVNQKKCSRVLL